MCAGKEQMSEKGFRGVGFGGNMEGHMESTLLWSGRRAFRLFLPGVSKCCVEGVSGLLGGSELWRAALIGLSLPAGTQ